MIQLIKLTIMIATCILSVLSSAQSTMTTIKSDRIFVGLTKTTNLLFPFAIKSADIGSDGIVAQIAPGAENILQVKAAIASFTETNLTVVTSDGKFYSFIVDFAAAPDELNIAIAGATTARSNTGSQNEADNNITAKIIVRKKAFLHLAAHQQRVTLYLYGIYTSAGNIWFHLGIENKAVTSYLPDYVSFFIRNKQRSKRSAVQERNLQHLYKSLPDTVRCNTVAAFVYGFTPFTVYQDQQLVIQVNDRNTGRLLQLVIPARIINKMKQLQF